MAGRSCSDGSIDILLDISTEAIHSFITRSWSAMSVFVRHDRSVPVIIITALAADGIDFVRWRRCRARSSACFICEQIIHGHAGKPTAEHLWSSRWCWRDTGFISWPWHEPESSMQYYLLKYEISYSSPRTWRQRHYNFAGLCKNLIIDANSPSIA